MASSDLVQSLLRGLDVMIMLSDSKEGMRVNEVADAVGVKSPAAYNILRTLSARNMVEKRASKYCLGSGVEKFAIYNSNIFNREIYKSCLVDLSAKYPEVTFTIAKEQQGRVLTWLRVSPDRPATIQEPVESEHKNPYGNASGIACQAFAGKEKCEQVWMHYPFFEYGAHLWQSYEKLEKHLTKVKAAGFAEIPFDDKVRVGSAAPVYIKGEFVDVVGVSAKVASPDKRDQQQEELNNLVLEIQKSISNNNKRGGSDGCD